LHITGVSGNSDGIDPGFLAFFNLKDNIERRFAVEHLGCDRDIFISDVLIECAQLVDALLKLLLADAAMGQKSEIRSGTRSKLVLTPTSK
jgi:hypothetical protein